MSKTFYFFFLLRSGFNGTAESSLKLSTLVFDARFCFNSWTFPELYIASYFREKKISCPWAETRFSVYSWDISQPNSIESTGCKITCTWTQIRKNSKSISNNKQPINGSSTACDEDVMSLKQCTSFNYVYAYYLYNKHDYLGALVSLLVLKHFEKVKGDYFRVNTASSKHSRGLKVLERCGDLQRICLRLILIRRGTTWVRLTFVLHVTIRQNRYLRFDEIQPVFAADRSSLFTLINFLTRFCGKIR